MMENKKLQFTVDLHVNLPRHKITTQEMHRMSEQITDVLQVAMLKGKLRREACLYYGGDWVNKDLETISLGVAPDLVVPPTRNDKLEAIKDEMNDIIEELRTIEGAGALGTELEDIIYLEINKIKD